MAGIERGTNRTGRRIFGRGEGHREVDPAETRRQQRPVLRRAPAAGGAGVGARGEEIEEVADVDHAARDRRGSRRRPAGGNGRRCGTGSSRSPRVVSAATATMSARGTMTSSTRMRWKPRTFFSIARSWGEKSGSSTVSARASSRSSRIDSRDFRTPKRVRQALVPALAHAFGVRDGRAGRSSRLRSSFIAALSFSRTASVQAAISRIGIGDAKGASASTSRSSMISASASISWS